MMKIFPPSMFIVLGVSLGLASISSAAPAATNPTSAAKPAGAASSALTSEAWQALEKKDYVTARARVETCRKKYESEAIKMQSSLTSLPGPDRAHSFWALNDVGTCLFILGKVEEAQGKPQKAITTYQDLVKRFPLAQCWDKQGWFWQPSVAAKERIAALTLDSAK